MGVYKLRILGFWDPGFESRVSGFEFRGWLESLNCQQIVFINLKSYV